MRRFKSPEELAELAQRDEKDRLEHSSELKIYLCLAPLNKETTISAWDAFFEIRTMRCRPAQSSLLALFHDAYGVVVAFRKNSSSRHKA